MPPELTLKHPEGKIQGFQIQDAINLWSKDFYARCDFNLKGPKLKGDVDVSVPKVQGDIKAPKLKLKAQNWKDLRVVLRCQSSNAIIWNEGPKLEGPDVDVKIPKADYRH